MRRADSACEYPTVRCVSKYSCTEILADFGTYRRVESALEINIGMHAGLGRIEQPIWLQMLLIDDRIWDFPQVLNITIHMNGYMSNKMPQSIKFYDCM